jgi:hypothetical protein
LWSLLAALAGGQDGGTAAQVELADEYAFLL